MAFQVYRSLHKLHAALAVTFQDMCTQQLPKFLIADCRRNLTASNLFHSSATLLHGDDTLQRKAIINRLLYRSKQRGFLELDLLVGLWAEKNVSTMSQEQLVDFGKMLEQENPDMFKWLTGQLPPSEEMQQNSAFQALRDHVKRKLDENSQATSQTMSGKQWVRGWDDWKKGDVEPSQPAST